MGVHVTRVWVGWKCFIKLKLLVVSVLKICAVIFLMTLFTELRFVTLSLPDPPSLCSGKMFPPYKLSCIPLWSSMLHSSGWWVCPVGSKHCGSGDGGTLISMVTCLDAVIQ